jgi:hypothetical protein
MRAELRVLFGRQSLFLAHEIIHQIAIVSLLKPLTQTALGLDVENIPHTEDRITWRYILVYYQRNGVKVTRLSAV